MHRITKDRITKDVSASTDTAILISNETSGPQRANSLLSQFREYIPTIFTETTVLVSQILIYKMAAYFLGKSGFSEYAVTRRAVSLLLPIPLLGFAVGLPRYIAHCQGRGDDGVVIRYYSMAILCAGIATLCCLSMLNLSPKYFALLLFGNRSYFHFIFPLSLMLAGLVGHSLVYSYFRGCLLMTRANVLQLVNLAAVPIFCLLKVRNSTPQVLLWIGILWVGVSLIGICFTPILKISFSSFNEGRELLRYGLQRVPGDFILMALLALPVILVAHRMGVQEAGFVAFAVSIISMIGAFFTPVGLILLPKASGLLASGRMQELRIHVMHIVRISLVISTVAAGIVAICASLLIKLYLGAGFEQAAYILRFIILGAIPYALFAVLRNLIDAFHRNAVTALVSTLGFFVFIGWSCLARSMALPGHQILIGLLFGLSVLGGAAFYECMRILRT